MTTRVQQLLEDTPGRGFQDRAAQAGLDLPPVVSSGRLSVDVTGYEACLDGVALDLSPRQVELLALFLAAPTRVWSRAQLHHICWGETAPSRRVDVQLCRLRGRTGLDLLRNVRDRGWALRPLACIGVPAQPVDLPPPRT